MDIPLIVHTINYANANSEILNSVVVPTDDPLIKELAIEKGVEVIDRPVELSGDNSPTVHTLKHVIEQMDSNFDQMVLLQPTNPLRPKNLLKQQFLKGQQIVWLECCLSFR